MSNRFARLTHFWTSSRTASGGDTREYLKVYAKGQMSLRGA